MQFGKISSVQYFFIVPKNAFPAFKTVALTGKVAANVQRQTVIFRFSGSGLPTELFGGGQCRQWSLAPVAFGVKGLKAVTSVLPVVISDVDIQRSNAASK